MARLWFMIIESPAQAGSGEGDHEVAAAGGAELYGRNAAFGMAEYANGHVGESAVHAVEGACDVGHEVGVEGGGVIAGAFTAASVVEAQHGVSGVGEGVGNGAEGFLAEELLVTVLLAAAGDEDEGGFRRAFRGSKRAGETYAGGRLHCNFGFRTRRSRQRHQCRDEENGKGFHNSTGQATGWSVTAKAITSSTVST